MDVGALPFIGHYGCNAIYYNEDLLTRSGVPLPPADANWTVDDLVDRARRVVATGNAAGFVPATGIQECGTAWLRTFGGELLSADGKRGLIDSRLLSLTPVFGTMVRVFGQPGPFHAPHNTRTDEINKAVDSALQPLWDGKIAPRDAARSAAEAISQILSQPL